MLTFASLDIAQVTMLWALYIAYRLPASPAEARWLTPEQRARTIERGQDNKTGTAAQAVK